MTSLNLREILSLKLPFWGILSDEDQNLLIENTFYLKHKKGSFVYGSNKGCSGFLYVVDGALRGYIMSEDGRDVTLMRVKPKDMCILTASCILSDMSLEFYLEAISDTNLLNIDIMYIKKLSDKYPEVQAFAYQITTKRFGEAIKKIQEILFKGVDQRIAKALLNESIDQNTLDIKITHDQLAKDIGSVREVVSRTLKYLEEEEILLLRRGKVNILKLEKLKKLAN
ncbi:MAG: Crp/Fnr family transcriptional regulator [Tissierellia bacterium]|nr:Crp/Fnr family transcriptional regulator [Tissierellia bacterium]